MLKLIQVDSKNKFYLTESGPSVLGTESTTDNGVIQSDKFPKRIIDSLIVKTLPKAHVAYKVYVTFLLLDEPDEVTNQ